MYGIACVPPVIFPPIHPTKGFPSHLEILQPSRPPPVTQLVLGGSHHVITPYNSTKISNRNFPFQEQAYLLSY